MIERRGNERRHVVYGATLEFHGMQSTLDCTIKNISPRGAMLVFGSAWALPPSFHLHLRARDEIYAARLVWCDSRTAGVAFEAATVVDLNKRRQRIARNSARRFGDIRT